MNVKMQKTILNASKRHFSLPVIRYILLLPWSIESIRVGLKGDKKPG